jgi:dynein heavy chain
VFDVKYAEK